MKRIHLLRTTVGADAVAGLAAAAAAEGLRLGWLDLSAGTPASGPAPDSDLTSHPAGTAGALASLESVAAAGALRAVSFAGGCVVTVKRVTGPPVLRDLLREHFLGCAAVLVRVPPGDAPAPVDGVDGLPRLDPAVPPEEGWRVVRPEGGSLHLATADLVVRLRRPRPWSSP